MIWTESTPINTTNLNALETRIDQANQAVTDAKTPIAAAITTMGQAASATDSFTVLSDKIQDISNDADAVVGDVLNTKTFYQGGNKKTGTMPNRGAVTITPSASNQTITNGYHNGSGVVNAVTFTAANVLTGTTIAGTAGTMPNQGSPTFTPSASNQGISAGYYSGGTISGDSDLIASNILSGKNIFGVVGTAKAQASGSNTSDGSGNLTVTGLGFTPTLINTIVNSGGLLVMRTWRNPDTGSFNTKYIGNSSGTYSIGTPGDFTVSAGQFSASSFGSNLSVTWRAFE